MITARAGVILQERLGNGPESGFSVAFDLGERMVRLAAAALAVMIWHVAAFADVYNDIRERGAIKLGVRQDAPPFSYTAPNGEPTGLAVRICRQIVRFLAEDMGVGRLGVEYIRVDAKQRFPALLEERTHLHCGPATATLSRREILDFSMLYFVDGAGAAIRPQSYDTVFDKGARRFGVLSGTTTVGVVEDLVSRNNLDATVETFASHGEGLRALANEKLDVYFGDQAILFFQIEKLGLINEVSMMEDIFSFEPYALVMKRGESNLRLAVDRALSRVYDQGMIYGMILEEMGNYPLSEDARALYQIVGLPE